MHIGGQIARFVPDPTASHEASDLPNDGYLNTLSTAAILALVFLSYICSQGRVDGTETAGALNSYSLAALNPTLQ